MSMAVDLLKQNRKDLFWKKYCGFLDLSMDEFMHIQERLLLEQIQLISKNEIGRYFLGDRIPRSIEEFRWRVPITSYDNYEQFFAREDRSYPDTCVWAHTSGKSGNFKWIPYTRRSYQKLGERSLSMIILASARERGEVRLKPNDNLVYNTPPRPYISGIVLRSLGEEFPFTFIPPMEKTEDMDFQERILTSFNTSMRTGIDVLGSMSSVLIKMGERFAQGAQTGGFSKSMLHPKTMNRMIRGFLKSKLEHRAMLPKDLWQIKALLVGGTDTAIYRNRVKYLWGVEPFESYGSTEEGSFATQAWNKKNMTFFPDASFYEFIPEEEVLKWQSDPFYVPRTVLYNEVEPNKRYEMIISNFYGKPLLRYRMHDLVQFPEMEDREAGIRLPQMAFYSRTMEIIDLAGWTGLIDERMVWRAIIQSGVEYVDWTIRKEVADSKPYLRLYIEPVSKVEPEHLRQSVHDALKELNRFYADYEAMIEKRPLEVTVLEPGTFQKYMLAKQRMGADLAHLKPAHMNASDENIRSLLECSSN